MLENFLVCQARQPYRAVLARLRIFGVILRSTLDIKLFKQHRRRLL